MASEALKLRYAVDAKTMAAAMGLAGAKIQKSPSRSLRLKRYGALALAFVILVGAGEIAERVFDTDIWNPGFLVGMAWAMGVMYLMQRVAIAGLAEGVTETAMKRGDIRLTIGPGGLSEQSGIGRMDIVWDVVEDIDTIGDATLIRFGGMCFAVPDTALPEDMDPARFRDQLAQWRDASEVFG